MCGIVGYIGGKQACDILIDGLNKLEYRGYDSAGIAVYNKNKITVKKYQGRLKNLEEKLKEQPLAGVTGIGHTRWATHGAPSDKNAHPHSSSDGLISIVHNGIIENYRSVKEELQSKGVVFSSDTDTEVIAHLIRSEYENDIFEAVFKAIKKLKGAYALAVICANEPDKIIAVRKDSPLIIGLGENENFIASDIPAILNYTRDVYLIDNNTFAVVMQNGVKLYDENKEEISKDIFHVTWNAEAAGKNGYEHYMLKEIQEQPDAITYTLRSRIKNNEIILDDFKLSKKEFDKISKIYIVACGTAYYAGCVGKLLIEKYARVSVETMIASEFRYNNPIIDKNTLFIAISQSGETADTLASMRLAKEKGARILAVSNVVGSSVAREADDVLFTWAGPEIAVASTKAYSTQVVCMYLTALKLGKLAGTVKDEDYDSMIDACLHLSESAFDALKNETIIKKTAKSFKDKEDIFFIGRNLDYCLALEGALKMKEISYIHAEAYQAGELKHGPIALIEKGTFVVALCTQKGEILEKMISNIKEVKARGAHVVAVAQKSCTEIEEAADEVIYINDIFNDAAVVPAVILLQLLAYYVSVSKGCDVDKPRNLAKSVTVE
jgi:glucosamine--fructose-6-phosphate aminotransferase (isomerizing)